MAINGEFNLGKKGRAQQYTGADRAMTPHAIAFCRNVARPLSWRTLDRSSRTSSLWRRLPDTACRDRCPTALEQFHFEIALKAESISIGCVNEEWATILQDSKIAYRCKAIPEGQDAGRVAGQLDFAANSQCSVSTLTGPSV